jgi:hypothetical protein
VKLLAVVPLTWGVPPTATEAPVVVKVATRAVTLVPKGTVSAMVEGVPSVMTLLTAGDTKLKAVMALLLRTTIPVWLPVMELVTVSVAVIVWVPAVLRMPQKSPSPLERVELAGKTAAPSVLVMATKPA